MNLTRGQLKQIYAQLPNAEKTQWATYADYSGYQGLYRYLHSRGDEVAYNRVIQALEKTVGSSRFNILAKEVMQQSAVETQELQISGTEMQQLIVNIKALREDIVDTIPYFDDIEGLEEVEEVLDLCLGLLRNQKDRLKLLAELKKL